MFLSTWVNNNLLHNCNFPNYRWYAPSPLIYHIIDNLLHYLDFFALPLTKNDTGPSLSRFLERLNNDYWFTAFYKCFESKIICYITNNLPHYRWNATSSVICHITSNLLHFLNFSTFPKCTKFSIFIHVFRFLSQR